MEDKLNCKGFIVKGCTAEMRKNCELYNQPVDRDFLMKNVECAYDETTGTCRNYKPII